MAVCQGLSARHLKDLKDKIRLDAKFISHQLDSPPPPCPRGLFQQKGHQELARERLHCLETLE